ncbi:hypothetical protein QWY99_10665 [Flavobacterium branchiarum]|uniref:Uncharacterized protein n=1 Tax=Flavobacterium branchiarum TaxID=1114870 RepID=A0ABV5FSA4_9FLAO|nr:hypothetical protein [Flavobacterium branchiarum]MDN3673515.1 hypothetical protein [Flavobacterium branchiarum]
MKQIITIICFFFFTHYTTHAQYILGGYNGGQPVFSTYAEMVSGKTLNNQISIPLQYYGPHINVNEWKLTARLTQDFTSDANNAYTVGAQYSSLKFNSQENSGSENGMLVNVPTQVFQLSKYNEVTLIHSNVNLNGAVNRIFRYNLSVQGGNHLLVTPNGMYNSSYEFKLYKISNGIEQLIGIYTSPIGSARFQLSFGGNFGSQSVMLQNGAQQFNINYSTATDYATEKSVTIANALRVNTYNSQLAVEASGDFISPASSQTIPLSILKLQLSTNQSYNGLQIISPITLAPTTQPIAIKSSNTPQDITYNVKFFIPANSPGLNVSPGTYSTRVYFVIMPN